MRPARSPVRTNVGSRTHADSRAVASIAGHRAITSESASKSQRTGSGVPAAASGTIAETSSSSTVWHGSPPKQLTFFERLLSKDCQLVPKTGHK